MLNKLKYNIFFFIPFLLVSCVTNKDTRLLQEEKGIHEYESNTYQEYKLQPNDEIILMVHSLNKDISTAFNLGNQTNSQSSFHYRIYKDGTVDIPFSDSIAIAGLTIQEAKNKIETGLKVVSEDVTVNIELYNNYFYLIGKSGKGQYKIYKDKLTIYQAIALGKFSPGIGNLREVKIIRQGEDGTPIVVTFDLRSKSIVESAYYYVQPNDVIYIESSKGSFFKIQSFNSFVGVISSSLAFLLLMLNYM